MDAYRGFAAVYDLLMDDFDYPAWAAYYLALLRQAGVEPRMMCDCACGTGSLAVEFARGGVRVTGVDLSPEMLEMAAAKARERGAQIQFVCQDMTKLRLPRPVDAIICGCDGVNYLTTDAQVRAFFRAAHAALRPGGALAFDISSPHTLRHTLGNNFFGEERDDVAYLWQNSLEGDIVTMDLTFFLRESDGRYRRAAETHRQRAHEPEQLRHMLEECGFEKIEIFGDQSFQAPEPEEKRIHLLAVRK